MIRVISNLIKNPLCRRQVIGILDPHTDTIIQTKDMPCNLVIHFMRRPNECLDMTVFNRSNDMIWGAYGANAVHFSFLQEIIARSANLKIGRYHQVSDNFHCYKFHMDSLGELAEEDGVPSPYRMEVINPFPVISENVTYQKWVQEAHMFWGMVSSDEKPIGFTEPFFKKVAIPMLNAWKCFKDKDDVGRIDTAIRQLNGCKASDWKKAGIEWLNRRKK